LSDFATGAALARFATKGIPNRAPDAIFGPIVTLAHAPLTT
jgi:hypothetical protein